MINFTMAKQEMIDKQLKRRGITNKSVLEAFEKVDRHLFVRDENIGNIRRTLAAGIVRHHQSYDDNALPIGLKQTISQPYITALMTELLYPSKDEIILEIGTGSGYQTAILSQLSKFVVSVERNRELIDFAKNNLQKLEIKNTSLMFGDGTLGWKDNAPYDGIIVTAGGPSIPKALIDQLKVGGRMVIPVGENGFHKLKLVLKEENDIIVKNIIDCGFVPLIGRGV